MISGDAAQPRSRKPGVVVRPRIACDVPACVNALRDVHRADGYPSMWPDDPHGWLTPRGLLAAWVVRSGSLLLGHIAAGIVDGRADPYLVTTSCCSASDIVEVKRLFVLPAARGSGIAALLLNEAAAFAVARGLQPMLEVTADRREAIRLYERSGWERVGSNDATWTRTTGERPLLYQYRFVGSVGSAENA